MIIWSLERAKQLERTFLHVSDNKITKTLDILFQKGVYYQDSSSQKNTVLIVSGGVAAGKSTVLYNIQSQFGFLDEASYVGTDSIYRVLYSKYSPFEYGYNCARDYANKYVNHLIDEKRSFIWETVFSKEGKFDLLDKLVNNGYYIICLYVGADNPDCQVQRSSIRSKNGYHYVSPDFVKNRYYITINNLRRLQEYVNSMTMYDNTDQLALIYHCSNNESFIAGKAPEWVRGVY